MQTSKWGPSMWLSLHTIAHNFDPDNHDVEAHKQHFLGLAKVLPCKYCRHSFAEFITEINIDDYIMKKPYGLHQWLYLIHNKVNKKLRDQGLLDKPDPTFKQVLAKYDKFRADCSKKTGRPSTCRMPDSENQCKSKTKKGRQCSRKQCGGARGKCSQHAQCTRRPRSRQSSH